MSVCPVASRRGNIKLGGLLAGESSSPANMPSLDLMSPTERKYLARKEQT